MEGGLRGSRPARPSNEGLDGKPSILEKVYIQAKEKAVGFPKVIYLDLFGYDTKTKAPAKERITPKE